MSEEKLENITEKTLALAGVFQAVKLVKGIAERGRYDSYAMETSLSSVFKLDAESVEEIYTDKAGTLKGLQLGLQMVAKHLNQGSEEHLVLAKYAIASLKLSKRLLENQQSIEQIGKDIKETEKLLQELPIGHENIVASIADSYDQVLGSLEPRIMVNGKKEYLENNKNANQIRAMLMAAVRSAVLWQQKGGSRWQILFKRRFFVDEANRLLDSL